MIHIYIKTEYNSTEDPKKLKTVLTNFSSIIEDKIELIETDSSRFFTAEASGIEILKNFFEGIRKQQIVQSARKILNIERDSEGVSFMLNKQALFVGKFHFSETPDESPMGPVHVRIESDNIDSLIEYLVPETRKGIPIEVDYLPE
ncbi:unnamed protein product [marine sediment metagenome]|uniref:Uncharacterized protein n=1 Tax=marine sediment metagenome TaxID=412755 RepID=X0U3Q6_9ZZZZ